MDALAAITRYRRDIGAETQLKLRMSYIDRVWRFRTWLMIYLQSLSLSINRKEHTATTESLQFGNSIRLIPHRTSMSTSSFHITMPAELDNIRHLFQVSKLTITNKFLVIKLHERYILRFNRLLYIEFRYYVKEQAPLKTSFEVLPSRMDFSAHANVLITQILKGCGLGLPAPPDTPYVEVGFSLAGSTGKTRNTEQQ